MTNHQPGELMQRSLVEIGLAEQLLVEHAAATALRLAEGESINPELASDSLTVHPVRGALLIVRKHPTTDRFREAAITVSWDADGFIDQYDLTASLRVTKVGRYSMLHRPHDNPTDRQYGLRAPATSNTLGLFTIAQVLHGAKRFQKKYPPATT